MTREEPITTMETTRPASARVRLARIAERAIDADDRVSATAGAGRWLTRDGDRTIAGVVAAEAVTGAIDLGLHLIVETPTEPLEQRASLLRQAIVGRAIAANLVGRLGGIDVSFHDVAASVSEGTP
jgi:hypothetical protein